MEPRLRFSSILHQIGLTDLRLKVYVNNTRSLFIYLTLYIRKVFIKTGLTRTVQNDKYKKFRYSEHCFQGNAREIL